MSKNYVRNTEAEVATPAGALGTFLEMVSGGASGAIERMEARGQQELVASDVLPTKGTTKEQDAAKWTAIGVKLGDVVEGDDALFRYATFPAGWRLKPTERPTHSHLAHLVDAKGRVRARIFYKAAFYDRYAHVSLVHRYSVSASTEYGGYKYDEPHIGIVLDGELELHRTRLTTEADLTPGRYGCKKSHADAAREMAAEWLDANYPQWGDVTAYWEEP